MAGRLTGMDGSGKNLENLRIEAIVFAVARSDSGDAFQIHRLGLRERMKPCLVDRPEVKGDYLSMLFHAEVRVRSRDVESAWPASSLIIWAPGDGHFYGRRAGPFAPAALLQVRADVEQQFTGRLRLGQRPRMARWSAMLLCAELLPNVTRAYNTNYQQVKQYERR